MPRHPPYTLSSLTTFIDHRHVPRTSLTGTSEPAGRAVTVATTRCSSRAVDAIANGSDRQKGARRLPTRQKDQNGRESRSSLFLLHRASHPAKDNKPLNLVIHLSKSNNFRLKAPATRVAGLCCVRCPAERGSVNRFSRRWTDPNSADVQPATVLSSLEVSSPRLVGDLIVSGSLRLAAACINLSDAQT